MSNRSTSNSMRAAAASADDQANETLEATAASVRALGLRVDSFQSTLTEHGSDIVAIHRELSSTNEKLDILLSRIPSVGSTSESSPPPPSSATHSSDSAAATSASSTIATPHDSAAEAARGAPSARSRGNSIAFSTSPSATDTRTAPEGPAVPGSRPHLNIKPEELGRFDGTPEDTELFLSDVLAIYESEPDPANLVTWEKAILRALPRSLKGSARLWFSTLDSDTRSKMTTLQGKNGWFDKIRANFGATPAVVRQQARQRVWDPDTETILHYTFAKVALLKTAWKQLEDNDCITDVVDGLPLDIRQLLRVPLLRSPQIDELRDEMRVQETYWRERTARPLLKTSETEASSSPAGGTPGYITLLPASAPAQTSSFVQNTSSTQRTFTRSRRGKSIREDFDPSRLGYGPHPSTGKRTMTYRVPDTNELMWCNRPCRQCKADHFDFAHEHCSNNIVHIVEVDEEYPVTQEGPSGQDF
ncbi:hypothetical protein CF326_g6777 [Tilletia indica]|nr:hypothetical protein CF326_g6777 [Tilletia indica]